VTGSELVPRSSNLSIISSPGQLGGGFLVLQSRTAGDIGSPASALAWCPEIPRFFMMLAKDELVTALQHEARVRSIVRRHSFDV